VSAHEYAEQSPIPLTILAAEREEHASKFAAAALWLDSLHAALGASQRHPQPFGLVRLPRIRHDWLRLRQEANAIEGELGLRGTGASHSLR
jgi:hypothetical protein